MTKLYNNEEQIRYENMIAESNMCDLENLYKNYSEENIIHSCNMLKSIESLYKIEITDYDMIAEMFNVLDDDTTRHKIFFVVYLYH